MWKLFVLFGIFIASNVFSQEERKDVLNVETIWKDYTFYGNGVEGFRSMEDGIHYTRFVRNEAHRDIVQFKFNEPEWTSVLLEGKGLTYNNKEVLVEDYAFNLSEDQLLLQTKRQKRYRRSYVANYFLYDLKTKELAPLDEAHSPQTLATFSPDGSKIAYIHDNNIYVKELKTNKVTPITTDGKRNHIINGTTDWVYEEEFAITKAFGWSPDSKHIAFLKFDETNVKDFTMSYYLDLYPLPYTFKYPKAGEDNSKVSLHISTIKSGETEKIDLAEYEYIPRLNWSTEENQLLVQTLNRHQNHLTYYAVSKTKKTWNAQAFYEEKDAAYVEIDDNLLFLPDGKRFIRTSEQDGFNHIYSIGLDGSKQQLTKGEWDVIEVKGIHRGNNTIYFTAAKEGAPYRGLYTVSIESKAIEQLSKEKGHNDATFSKGMKYYVQTWNNANTPSIFTLHTADGSVLDTLEKNEILVDLLELYNFQPKHFIEVPGAEVSLNASIIYPPDFDSTQQYPVYFHIYCGPGSNLVRDSYNGGDLPYHQLLAQSGYIVVTVDTRGTMYRGAKFKKSTYLQLGKLEIEDMIAVANHFKQLSYVNPERIGIMGWSYGGYMSSLAMTKGEGLFKMGIAVAPVTNWRFYDNIYTERFMRTPQENESGYDDNSPINFAHQLQGNYFIIHGSGDDNVHVQNTMMMINALVDANKPFDMFIYPNKNHGIYGGNTRNHLFQMLYEYTLEKL